MAQIQSKISCPKCGEEISIDEVLTRQIEGRVLEGFKEEQRKKDEAIFQKEKEIEIKEKLLQEEKENIGKQVQDALEIEKRKHFQQMEAEKIKIKEETKKITAQEGESERKLLQEQLEEKDQKLREAKDSELVLRKEKIRFDEEKKDFELEKQKQMDAERKKIEEEAFNRALKQGEANTVKLQKLLEEKEKEKLSETAILKDELKEKESKLREASEKEIEIRKEKNKLEEEKKNFELEKQRQLDGERAKIKEEASQKAAEEQQFRFAELAKQLNDARKVNDELKRKLEQGSQQSQGEVLELALEEILQQEFPEDEITPVPKGINGADIIQKVCARIGTPCGQIAWESKRTKDWNENWIQKLKDDQRMIKADVAVIISSVLPDNIKGFALRDGVWICDIKLSTALATALRITLQGVSRERRLSVGKNEKMEVLYTYLTGVEFKQRVEAIVEAFSAMKEGVEKERRAYEKIWCEREKQIQKVVNNTIGMYGDLSGLVTLPQIKALELPGSEKDNIA
jgi:hypothetical protein